MSVPSGYYVYEIADPRDGLVIYVGKGKGSRYRVHEYRVRRGMPDINRKLGHKLRKIIAEGLTLLYVIVQESLSEEEAYALEQELTREIGLENLCNLKHGGTNGAVFTEEVRVRMKQAAARRDNSIYSDPERCRRIALAKKLF